MDKELKNKDLEEVSGGSAEFDPEPKPEPKPQSKPVEEKCGDFLKAYAIVVPTALITKKLYTYCSECGSWRGDSCSKGHF